jgi:hypothetical protein
MPSSDAIDRNIRYQRRNRVDCIAREEDREGRRLIESTYFAYVKLDLVSGPVAHFPTMMLTERRKKRESKSLSYL